MESSEEKLWFAMRATYRRELLAKDKLAERGVESYVPMRHEYVQVRGRRHLSEVPAVHCLIFVRATKSELNRVKRYMPYLQYIVCRKGLERQPIVVPERQMETFMRATGDADASSLYFSGDEINIAKGTRVRIHGGVLDGCEAVFMKVKGARAKRAVVAVQGVVAVALATVTPDMIEVLD